MSGMIVPLNRPLTTDEIARLKKLTPEQLADWEKRLIEKMRLLRAGGNASMILVKFDGPAMTLWRLTPDGRVSE